MEALIEAEMGELLSENLPGVGESSQDQVSGSKEPSVKDRSIIDMDYENEGGSDIDENDEKTLLYRQLTFSNLGE